MKLNSETVIIELKNGTIINGTITGKHQNVLTYYLTPLTFVFDVFRCGCEHEHSLENS